MKWNTSISQAQGDDRSIRGVSLSELIQKNTFTEAVFLLLSGKLPTDSERRVFDAMLTSACEHGVEAPSAFVPRVSASVGNPLHVAVAAGILSIGDFHGGAVESAAQLFKNRTSAKEVIESGERFPGFGHKVYKDVDPRAELILSVAQSEGIAVEEIEHARAIGKELALLTGKSLPLNIDGAFAALMLGLSLPPTMGKALFAFARMPGMIAHAYEESVNEKPYRRFEDTDVTYSGPQ